MAKKRTHKPTRKAPAVQATTRTVQIPLPIVLLILLGLAMFIYFVFVLKPPQLPSAVEQLPSTMQNPQPSSGLNRP